MSAAVESLTAELANATINDTAADAGNGQADAKVEANGTDKAAVAENEAALAGAAEGRRLYIGNLAYAVTEEELKELFTGFAVESASIPKNPRTGRPVGYAFVVLTTVEEAERAIADLNSKTLRERKVSVQIAHTPDDKPEGVASNGGEASNGEHRRRSSTRGRGRGRGRGGRGGRGGRSKEAAGNGEPVEGESAAPADSTPTNVPGQVLPLVERTNGKLTNGKDADGAAAASAKQGKSFPPRERKQRGPPEDGIPSKVKVMVANLPYDLREDRLMEIFKDYEPSAAKIALRPIPRFMIKKLQSRNEPRRGRGFGFVTLGSEELQQKACTEMNGKEIEGREIAVKVAIDSPGKEDHPADAPGEANEASTAPAPAPASAEAAAEAAPAVQPAVAIEAAA